MAMMQITMRVQNAQKSAKWQEECYMTALNLIALGRLVLMGFVINEKLSGQLSTVKRVASSEGVAGRMEMSNKG